MEAEFLSYLRTEAQVHAKYIVIILCIYSFFLFCSSMYKWKVHEDKDNIVVFLLYLVPSLILAIIYQSSFKYEKLANIYGIALYLSYAVTLLAMYTANQIPFQNKQVVNQLQVSIVIFLVIYGGFFNLRVVVDVPTRIICLFIIATTLIMMFHKNIEDYNTGSAIIFDILITIFCESFFFVNLKAKAKLFLRIKVTQR